MARSVRNPVSRQRPRVCSDTEIVVSTRASTTASSGAGRSVRGGTGGRRRPSDVRRPPPRRTEGPSSGRRRRCRARVPGRLRMASTTVRAECNGWARRGSVVGDPGHGDRDVVPIVDKRPALHVDQVEAVPTRWPGPGHWSGAFAPGHPPSPGGSQWSRSAPGDGFRSRRGRKKQQASAAVGTGRRPGLAFPSRRGHVPFSRDRRLGRSTRSRPVPFECRYGKGVPMEPHEEEEGWFTDPFGRHEASMAVLRARRRSWCVTATSSRMTSRPTKSRRRCRSAFEPEVAANGGADLIRAGDPSSGADDLGSLNQRMTDGALEGGAHPEVVI